MKKLDKILGLIGIVAGVFFGISLMVTSWGSQDDVMRDYDPRKGSSAVEDYVGPIKRGQ